MNPQDQHDPGGKIRLSPLSTVSGNAEFSQCGCYRYWLSRDWGFRRFSDGRELYALWIGMNPSTAEADVDDPTVRKEMGFTSRMGLFCYVKVNVMDFRSTSPSGLRASGVTPCSNHNILRIKKLAERATSIIVCWGNLHNSLRQYADQVLLNMDGHFLWCLGKNVDGSPKHPLYLRSDTKLVRF